MRNKDYREFLAKTITDLGKAILTVGFASYFFEKLPLFMRIGGVMFGFAFLVAGVIMFPKGENQKC